MILEFKTPRNTYGHRDYIKIDTDKKTFTRQAAFIPQGAEIKKTDYRILLDTVRADNYKEVN